MHATISIIIICTYHIRWKFVARRLFWQLGKFTEFAYLNAVDWFYCLMPVCEMPIGTYIWCTNGTVKFKAACYNWRDTMALQRVVQIAHYSYSYTSWQRSVLNPQILCATNITLMWPDHYFSFVLVPKIVFWPRFFFCTCTQNSFLATQGY